MKTDEAGIVISGRSWSASDFVRADGTPGPWTSKALEADPLSFEAELGRFLTEFFSPGRRHPLHPLDRPLSRRSAPRPARLSRP